MSNNEFRITVIPGSFDENGNFSFVEFKKAVVEIPKEFLAAAWGFGHYYGRHYGHT